uniref:Uncharacterized protein n=2 Tax=Hemiselmis andersenii TaxID=464988 RepID=A0A6U4UGD0_HEMAN|mmetsp:Transcript_13715/g.31747  ORF Transcript_13715/g.31747 Transcript_13715/m.31747 type:complete len:163 (+) Transcript_13715:50-538(+)
MRTVSVTGLAAALLGCVAVALLLASQHKAGGAVEDLYVVMDGRGNAMLVEDNGFDITGDMCCAATQWPCCMSKACCDKWEEEKLGEPDSASTAAEKMVGFMPTIVLSDNQVRQLEAAQLQQQQMGGFSPSGAQGYAQMYQQPAFFQGRPQQQQPQYTLVPVE